MDYILLTKTIVEMLVQDKEAVSVNEYETEDDGIIQLEVMVSESDLGTIIGKNGRTIASIRNIVGASALLNGDKKIKINVDSY